MRGSITLAASHGICFCGLSQGLNPVRSGASKLHYSLIAFAEFGYSAANLQRKQATIMDWVFRPRLGFQPYGPGPSIWESL
ncbi:hypothetical protein D5086_007986 [Populus alba]|uniref:Uncharacterized protein n=1 Tax=Populus alba TaxID=43335 RepID=A0ACC4CFM1_POPAL